MWRIILWCDGRIFVDLDDARNGPVVQDLWRLLHGDKAEQRMPLKMVVEAYEEFCEFDTAAELGLIELLRAMRLVYYLSWLSSLLGRSSVSQKLSLVEQRRSLAQSDIHFS